MKLSIQSLWHECVPQLNEIITFRSPIKWLDDLTPLNNYIVHRSNLRKLVEVNIPNFSSDKNNDIKFQYHNSKQEEVELSNKKQKKLTRLTQLLYKLGNKNELEPTDFVLSYFKHKTLTNKALLEERLKKNDYELLRPDENSTLEKTPQQALNNWCNTGKKYEYEQVLYFINQVHTHHPQYLQKYLQSTTQTSALDRFQFQNHTYLPFKKINNPKLWSTITFDLKDFFPNTQDKELMATTISFEFAEIPLIYNYLAFSNPDPNKESSILLMKNVRSHNEKVLLETKLNDNSEILVLGFRTGEEATN